MSLFKKEESDFTTRHKRSLTYWGNIELTANPEWRGEQLALNKDVQKLEKKVALLLEHLKLKYVEEREEKKPARLEVCNETVADGYFLGVPVCGSNYLAGPAPKKKGRPRKKKRGRPRKETV